MSLGCDAETTWDDRARGDRDLSQLQLAGVPREHIRAAIGGIKVTARSGWFAARPSGTEDIYKIYAESFAGADHLQQILKEAQGIVDRAIAGPVATQKAA